MKTKLFLIPNFARTHEACAKLCAQNIGISPAFCAKSLLEILRGGPLGACLPVRQGFYFVKSGLIFVLALSGCHVPPTEKHLLKYSETRPLFGTMLRVDICYDGSRSDDMKKAAQKVWDRFDDMQVRMNLWNERSDLTKINQSYGAPVQIGADTYALLQDAVKFNQLTRGVFDVTVYPLIEVWKGAAKKNRIPSREELLEAKKAIGFDKIKFLGNHRIQLLHPKAKVDINGIACGYGADEAARILRENGFARFLIDTGGELFASGKNCENKKWRLGIADPRDDSKLIDTIELEDQGVSTSGNYEKFYDIQGQRWSHIINPITGYPAWRVASATVIAPTATQADALSTALCVLGGERAIALIEDLSQGLSAMVIENNKGKLLFFKSRTYGQYRSDPP